MAHHKRHRPKHQRAGCLVCKPHKDERRSKQPKPSERRRAHDEARDGWRDGHCAVWCACEQLRPEWADVLAMPAGCHYYGELAV